MALEHCGHRLSELQQMSEELNISCFASDPALMAVSCIWTNAALKLGCFLSFKLMFMRLTEFLDNFGSRW